MSHTEWIKVLDSDDEHIFSTPALSAREILEQAWTNLLPEPVPNSDTVVQKWLSGDWQDTITVPLVPSTASFTADTSRTESSSIRLRTYTQVCSVGAMLLAKRILDQHVPTNDYWEYLADADPEFSRAIDYLIQSIVELDSSWWEHNYGSLDLPRSLARRSLETRVSVVTGWNDAGERTWDDVDQVFSHAIKLAIADEVST